MLLSGLCGRTGDSTPEGTGLGYAINAGAAFPVNSRANTDSMVTVGVSWYGPVSGDVRGQNSAIGLTADWMPYTRLIDGKQVESGSGNGHYKAYAPLGGYRIFANFGVGVIGATDAAPELDITDGANFGWTGGFRVEYYERAVRPVSVHRGQQPGPGWHEHGSTRLSLLK